MLVVLVICLIGLVAGSGFGIFFSGEDNGTGQTIRTAIAQINQEYQEKLEKSRQVTLSIPWRSPEARQFGRRYWPHTLSRLPPTQRVKRWPLWITKS